MPSSKTISSKTIGVGVFVIGGLLLFAIGLFMIGDRRQLFSKDFEISAEFAELGGLQNGAKVKVGGMDAGEVLEIQVPPQPQAKFRVRMRVLEDLHPVVRTDSVASIQTEGILGNKFLKIDPGTPQAPEAPPGSTIPSREPFDFADLMQQVRETVEEVRGQMDDVFESIARTSSDANQLISSVRGDVESIVSSGKEISEDIGLVVEGVRAGRGTVGRLFTDETLSENAAKTIQDFKEAAENMRQTSQEITEIVSEFQDRKIMGEVEETVKNLREVTAQAKEAVTNFQGKDGKGEGVAADVRRTLAQASEAMSDLAENMEALKRSFFFRGFFNRRGFYDLDKLTLTEYREGKFAKDKLSQRAWILESELFSKTPDNTEELSEQGRKRLDAVMADFLRYPANSTIIVEGYSGKGSPDEQFLKSRERAVKVREYLVKKFHLDPDYVGIMTMGAVASKSPSGSAWEGVSVVLYYDKSFKP